MFVGIALLFALGLYLSWRPRQVALTLRRLSRADETTTRSRVIELSMLAGGVALVVAVGVALIVWG